MRLRSSNVPISLLFIHLHLSYSVPQHIVRLRSSNVPISLLFIHSLLFQPSSTVAILNSLAIYFCPTFSPYIFLYQMKKWEIEPISTPLTTYKYSYCMQIIILISSPSKSISAITGIYNVI